MGYGLPLTAYRLRLEEFQNQEYGRAGLCARQEMSSRNPPTADIRDPKQSAYVNESLVEEIEWISQLNDRLRVTRTAGGPDGTIGTNVGNRSSKIS